MMDNDDEIGYGSSLLKKAATAAANTLIESVIKSGHNAR